MAKTRSFGGVNSATWKCVKSTSLAEHGTVYAPEGADKGTATTKVKSIGTIVLDFEYSAPKDTITYTIAKKPFLVTSGEIWNGIQETIDHCNS